jgi:hypothetical protein
MAKTYFQPEVTVASIALQSNLLSGSPSPAPAGDQMGISNITTDDQW